jgi:hypothetical protein
MIAFLEIARKLLGISSVISTSQKEKHGYPVFGRSSRDCGQNISF